MKRTLITIVLMMAASVAFCGTTSLRVMTYNVRYGLGKDGSNGWDRRFPASEAMIHDVKPVIFGVQEAYKFQCDYIQKACPEYTWVGVGRQDGSLSGEIMAIFYDARKLEMLDWGTFWLSETPEVPSTGWDAKYPRTATWAKMKVKGSGEELFFVNTHLDHKGVQARREGLKLAYNRIQAMNTDKLPIILLGDFNVLPDDVCLTDVNILMNSARFTAEKADTIGSFNGFGKKKELTAIDYIYWTGFAKCKTFKVVTTTYLNIPYISDHYPVYSDLEL